MDQTCGSLNSLYSRHESTLQEIIAEKEKKTVLQACAEGVPKQTNKPKTKMQIWWISMNRAQELKFLQRTTWLE